MNPSRSSVFSTAEIRARDELVSSAILRGASAPEMARFLAFSGHFAPLEFPVTRFVLFSSRDSVGGGPYLVEQAYPLAA